MESKPVIDARSEVLERIRAANGQASDHGAAARAWEGLPRNYRGGTRAKLDTEPKSAAVAQGTLELLIDRLRDYDAVVEQVSVAGVGETIRRVLAGRAHPRMLVVPGLPEEWMPEMNFEVDRNFPAAELDGFDGVLTGATLAIAETGTVVLQNAPGQGRRAATLVPDFHLCIVLAGDVVASVPEAVRRLQGTATLPTTFVSGPSATADIEMTRIKGVHGPRFLHVLLAT